jgi:hypothetical protein
MSTQHLVLRSGQEAWVIEWSTVVDAPIGSAVPVTTADRSDQRIIRALTNGTSFVPEPNTETSVVVTGEAEVLVNRAGRAESVLTLDQLIDFYCRGIGDEPPEGFRPWKHGKAEIDAFYKQQYELLVARGLDKPTNFTT